MLKWLLITPLCFYATAMLAQSTPNKLPGTWHGDYISRDLTTGAVVDSIHVTLTFNSDFTGVSTNSLSKAPYRFKYKLLPDKILLLYNGKGRSKHSYTFMSAGRLQLRPVIAYAESIDVIDGVDVYVKSR
jgi:hypothetical protein